MINKRWDLKIDHFSHRSSSLRERVLDVRDQMGHSSIKVTFDNYGHLFPGTGREAACRFDDSMKKARVKADAVGGNLVAATTESEMESSQERTEKAVSTN
jgi:hypothetical protein